ncbi:MAG: methylenetetrahydrofolate reductase, partial [Peptococcaceae bacterium]|nr:methylenetetrahydrofolate reductase [Peptococcaceae bacterium]
RGLPERTHILAGVMPIKSAKVAKYMQKNVSGMLVPQAVIERLEQAEDQAQEGVKICIEQIRHLKTIPGIHGVHIMAVAWEEIVPSIVTGAGLMPRL